MGWSAYSSQIVQAIVHAYLGKVANHQQASHDEDEWGMPVEDSRLQAPVPNVGSCLSSTSQDLHQAVLVLTSLSG